MYLMEIQILVGVLTRKTVYVIQHVKRGRTLVGAFYHFSDGTDIQFRAQKAGNRFRHAAPDIITWQASNG